MKYSDGILDLPGVKGLEGRKGSFCIPFLLSSVITMTINCIEMLVQISRDIRLGAVYLNICCKHVLLVTPTALILDCFLSQILALPAIPLTLSAGLLFGILNGTIIVSIGGTVSSYFMMTSIMFN